MDNKLVNVKNRSASVAIYRIPDMNIRREFAPGETMQIPVSELQKLMYIAGGRELLASYLQVTDDAVTENLNIPTEAEYYMSEEQVVELLKTGSLDALLDCLDFAPPGVIDLVKAFAVKLPLNDIAKREAIFKKTGFDVTKAIENDNLSKTEEKTAETAQSAEAPAATTTPKRRVVSNYKSTAAPTATKGDAAK